MAELRIMTDIDSLDLQKVLADLNWDEPDARLVETGWDRPNFLERLGRTLDGYGFMVEVSE